MALAEAIAEAAAEARVCCACGAGGRPGSRTPHPSVSDDDEEQAGEAGDEEGGDGASRLHFTTFTHLGFAAKRLRLTHAGVRVC